jgi:hypothetical protein
MKLILCSVIFFPASLTLFQTNEREWTFYNCYAVRIFLNFVRFEVLTAATTKGSVFWGISLCSPVKVDRSFGGT